MRKPLEVTMISVLNATAANLSSMESLRVPASSLDPKHNLFRLQKIYLIAIVLVMIGILQLVILKAMHIKLIDSVPVPNFMYMVIALVCIVLMVYTELFNEYPVNWTLGIVAVECVTLCTISSKWNHLPVLYASIVLGVVLIVNIMLYMLGACLPLILLPGYYGILFITIVFIIMYIFLSIIVFILSSPNLMPRFWRLSFYL
ncbi:uncharacterized protein LOC133837541 isoform X3 [Drosophila sulfurigaster albostrigata]|uniref:uncharacterized protein LOC133837541 isoform X3 n=1 Tax=Drosophila sulfurigaster albostrigata TaxID=89887 RepID=UPI002D21AF68|nr:uncharacterized protein LOC133837541 isoform X3 [Drosophila sulfurigaster albostrigata]